jgi:hypothetical protein
MGHAPSQQPPGDQRLLKPCTAWLILQHVPIDMVFSKEDATAAPVTAQRHA